MCLFAVGCAKVLPVEDARPVGLREHQVSQAELGTCSPSLDGINSWFFCSPCAAAVPGHGGAGVSSVPVGCAGAGGASAGLDRTGWGGICSTSGNWPQIFLLLSSV